MKTIALISQKTLLIKTFLATLIGSLTIFGVSPKTLRLFTDEDFIYGEEMGEENVFAEDYPDYEMDDDPNSLDNLSDQIVVQELSEPVALPIISPVVQLPKQEPPLSVDLQENTVSQESISSPVVSEPLTLPEKTPPEESNPVLNPAPAQPVPTPTPPKVVAPPKKPEPQTPPPQKQVSKSPSPQRKVPTAPKKPVKPPITKEIQAQYTKIKNWIDSNGGCEIRFTIRSQTNQTLKLDLEDIKNNTDLDIFSKFEKNKSKFQIFSENLENRFSGYDQSKRRWTINYKETLAEKCKEYKRLKKPITFYWARDHFLTPYFKTSWWKIDGFESKDGDPYVFSYRRHIGFWEWFSTWE